MIEDYADEGVTSSILCKPYHGNGHDTYIKQHLNQQDLVKNHKGAKRILVVDDEYDIGFTLKVVLEDNGFKVDSFTSVLMALESFKPGQYDLAIIDLKMPVMNGIGFYEHIMRVDDKVKICFLTAASDIYYEAFANFDENCIIRKPIENESLIKQLKSIINDSTILTGSK